MYHFVVITIIIETLITMYEQISARETMGGTVVRKWLTFYCFLVTATGMHQPRGAWLNVVKLAMSATQPTQLIRVKRDDARMRPFGRTQSPEKECLCCTQARTAYVYAQDFVEL